MTGREHIRKAEEHLGYAADIPGDNEPGNERAEQYHVQAAQAHATLALAATQQALLDLATGDGGIQVMVMR